MPTPLDHSPQPLPAQSRGRLSAFVRAVAWTWPLKPSGAIALGLAALALRAGRTSIDLVLTLAGLWSLLFVVLLGILAGCARLVFARDLARATRGSDQLLQGVEDQKLATGVRLPRRVWPLVCQPRWRWRSPQGAVETIREGLWRSEIVQPAERGMVDRIERVFEVEDLFGFWRFRGRLTVPASVRIAPDPGRLDPARVQACLASGDLLAHPLGRPRGDRVDYRTYTRSDPARLILWKVYARSRDLLVRTHEPARTPDARPLVYLVSGLADDAAAGAVRVLMESGVLGEGARLACDGQPTPVEDPEAIAEVIAKSRAARDRGGSDLTAALMDPTVSPDDPVVLICAAQAGPWQPRILGPLAANPQRFLVLGVTDAAPPEPTPTRLQRLLYQPPRSERAPAIVSQQSLQPMVATGARVLWADRVSGAVIVLAEGRHQDEIAMEIGA